MSKRLQILLSDEELSEIRAVATEHGMTVSEWVRRALRTARRSEAGGDVPRKLATVRAAARHGFPTADIHQMLDEIEAGYREQ
jgi:transposase-like protein